jgi:hypothetical protein
VADWLVKHPACLYIIDPLPNNSPDDLAERLPPFLRIVLEGRPSTPTLLLGERQMGDAAFMPIRGEVFSRKNHVLERVVDDARAAGASDLHVAVNHNWYGDDGEGSTDANHPNDLGASRMARSLIPLVKSFL